MDIDWGDGDYARTAAELAPAAEALVGAAGIRRCDHVLDVGCGTGNASLAAAARGAHVAAVDPSPRLAQIARDRSDDAGTIVNVIVAPAEALPFQDEAFDHVISCFAVIFAGDAERAVHEMVRVAKPGGVVALTTWLPGGAIRAAGDILRRGAPPPPGPPPRWDDPDWVLDLLARAGAPGGTVDRRTLVFTAASPEAWFAEQEEHHPVWRAMRRKAGEDAWADTRRESIRALARHNEADGDGFRTTSGYAVIRSERESAP